MIAVTQLVYPTVSFSFSKETNDIVLFVYCSGSLTALRGVNPTIAVTGTQLIQSPLLMPSKDNTFMKFRFKLGDQRSYLVGIKTIACYTDLGGNLQHTSWSSKLYVAVKESTRVTQRVCIRLNDVKAFPRECQSFKVTLQFDTGNVPLLLALVDFGTYNVCKLSHPTSFQCVTDLSSGDCGIRNDACGLVNWEIRPTYSSSNFETSNPSCEQQTLGFPLLKKKMSNKCSYDLQITEMQPSGFSIIRPNLGYVAQSVGTYRRRKRSTEYSLYLDPSNANGGVAVGILDLPVVQHSSVNAFLSFLYEMFETGLHDIMVAAVCTSDPANYLVPLDQYSLHYHKVNLDGTGDSGRICLDIHEYVLPEMCSSFAIQLHGAAVGTPLVVDTISFSSSLSELSCSKTATSSF